MVKKILISLVVFLLIFYFYTSFSSKNKDENEIFSVKNGSAEKTLSFSGKFQPKNYVDLSFETPTLISWVGIKVGDKVKKGQVLAKIDRNYLIANKNEAQTSLEKAIEAEKLARRKWDDYKPEEKEQIKKTVVEARFRLDSIVSQLSKSSLISPIDGVITEQEARQGEIAQGKVIRVIGENSFEVEADVSEADVVELYEGEEAEVTFDALGNDSKFRAKISRIDPESILNRDVVDFKTYFELIDNIDNSIRSGMTANIDVLVEKKDNVKIIPLRFIKRDDEGEYVFMQKESAKCFKFNFSIGNTEDGKCIFSKSDAKYEKKYIKTGVEGDDGMIEVKDGLDLSDKIMLIYEDAKK